MDSNYTDAVDRDKRKAKDFHIMSIAEIDGRILSELSAAVKNSGEDLLCEILSKYKTIPDKEILTLLQKFNIDYEKKPKIGDEGEKEDYSRKFLDINGQVFDIKWLVGFKKDDKYQMHGPGGMSYRIIVNEDKTEKTIYSNTIIIFPTEEARNHEWGKLKKKLELYNIIFI